jgi:hypothetical protein
MRRLNILIAALVIASASSGAEAACYEYQVRPASMGCAADRGNSVESPRAAREVVVAVQVACPATPAPVHDSSGSGGSYGNNCACDHSSSGGWH